MPLTTRSPLVATAVLDNVAIEIPFAYKINAYFFQRKCQLTATKVGGRR